MTLHSQNKKRDPPSSDGQNIELCCNATLKVFGVKSPVERQLFSDLYKEIQDLATVVLAQRGITGVRDALVDIDSWRQRAALHNRLGLEAGYCVNLPTGWVDDCYPHIEFLKKLVSACSDSIQNRSALVETLLYNIMRLGINRSGDQVTRVQDAMVRVTSHFGGDAFLCFPIMNNAKDPLDAAERLIIIDKILKGHSRALISTHQDSIFSVYRDEWPFFQGLIHRLEQAHSLHYCNELFALTGHGRWSTTVANTVLKLAETPSMAPALAAVANAMMAKQTTSVGHEKLPAQKLEELTRICPVTAPSILSRLQRTGFPVGEHFQFLQDIFLADIFHAGQVLEMLPLDQFRTDPQFFYDLVSAWKGSTWGLLTAYRRDNSGESLFDFMNAHESDAVAIRQRALSGSGMLFAQMPHELWGSLGQEYAQLFGPAAGPVYRRAVQKPRTSLSVTPEPEYLLECPDFRRYYEENAIKRGICHAERYLSTDVELVVHRGLSQAEKDELYRSLRENFSALDPSYKKKLELAVLALTTYDHNGALSYSLIQQFKALSDLGYKVVFCEANSGTEALNSVRKIVQEHHCVRSKVSRGASYLGFFAHADRHGMHWGDPESLQAGDALSADLGDALRLEDILSPKSPIINLFGCELGSGGRYANNFGKVMKFYNPTATVHAAAHCYPSYSFVSKEQRNGFVGPGAMMTRYW
jgi:hypothetical protein